MALAVRAVLGSVTIAVSLRNRCGSTALTSLKKVLVGEDISVCVHWLSARYKPCWQDVVFAVTLTCQQDLGGQSGFLTQDQLSPSRSCACALDIPKAAAEHRPVADSNPQQMATLILTRPPNCIYLSLPTSDPLPSRHLAGAILGYAMPLSFKSWQRVK